MVDLKLVDYIKRHIQRGYKKEEITQILIKNKWDKKDISEAFKYLSTKKVQPNVSSQPMQLQPKKQQPNKQQYLLTLKNFISGARAKGIKDDQIKNALLTKKWPTDLVNEAFSSLQMVGRGAKPVTKPLSDKPRQPFNAKLLVWYLIAFVVAGIIIAGTIFVYYYVVGLSQYTIVVDGEEQYGKCLELDCSDMKDEAFNYAAESLTLMLIIGGIASLLIVTLYAFLPFRNAILWIVNILYFLFLIFIGIRWIMFNQSIS